MARVLMMCVFIAFFTGTFICPPNGHAQELLIPNCNEKWCFALAQPPSSWPKAYTGKTVGLRFSPLIIMDAPAEILRIVRADFVTLFHYSNARTLAFSEGNKEMFPELNEATNGSSFEMADLFGIIFTKTPKDKEPNTAVDLRFWRLAMRLKSLYMLEPNATVFTGERDGITVYYKKETALVIGAAENTAIVINKKFPSYFLQISATNFSFSDFKEIIGTIQAINRVK